MVELSINGASHTLDVDPGEPAVFVLRNRLGLKGPKIGCGLEQCGACAVLVDGQPRLTCRMPIVDLQGAAVETIEGLRSPVQDVLLAHNASQCGYCLSGIVIAAESLFRENPAPSREQIVAALDPHLCRCGSQPRVIRALLTLATGA